MKTYRVEYYVTSDGRTFKRSKKVMAGSAEQARQTVQSAASGKSIRVGNSYEDNCKNCGKNKLTRGGN